jgi:hypothetical protein
MCVCERERESKREKVRERERERCLRHTDQRKGPHEYKTEIGEVQP